MLTELLRLNVGSPPIREGPGLAAVAAAAATAAASGGDVGGGELPGKTSGREGLLGDEDMEGAGLEERERVWQERLSAVEAIGELPAAVRHPKALARLVRVVQEDPGCPPSVAFDYLYFCQPFPAMCVCMREREREQDTGRMRGGEGERESRKCVSTAIA